jgi:hypothetical protein
VRCASAGAERRGGVLCADPPCLCSNPPGKKNTKNLNICHLKGWEVFFSRSCTFAAERLSDIRVNTGDLCSAVSVSSDPRSKGHF